jgi:hypothetical protein
MLDTTQDTIPITIRNCSGEMGDRYEILCGYVIYVLECRASHKVPSRSSERSMKVPNFN